MNKIESRFFTIKKQNVNQSIKTKTYANVMKTITKMTKNENEKKYCQKNNDDKYDDNTKKKIFIIKVKNEVEKKSKNDIERRISQKNQKSHERF